MNIRTEEGKEEQIGSGEQLHHFEHVIHLGGREAHSANVAARDTMKRRTLSWPQPLQRLFVPFSAVSSVLLSLTNETPADE